MDAAPPQQENEEEQQQQSQQVETSDGVCFWLQGLPQFKQHRPWQSGFHYLNPVQNALDSPPFVSFCQKWGLDNASYERNPHCIQGNAVYDRFFNALRRSVSEIDQVLVVFHGTSQQGIANILQNGLDPARRAGQAYGPGEYFSVNPGASVSFCRKNSNPVLPTWMPPQQQDEPPGLVHLKMIAFLVVLPMDDTAGKKTKRKYPGCPPEYIVVPTTANQLPLGVVSFTPTLGTVSSGKARELQKLSKKAREVHVATAEASLRAKVIQHMILDKLDVASELYGRNQGVLSNASKREIAAFALRKTNDAELVEIYFPGAKNDDIDELQNLDKLQEEVADVKKQIRSTAQLQGPVQAPAPIRANLQQRMALGQRLQQQRMNLLPQNALYPHQQVFQQQSQSNNMMPATKEASLQAKVIQHIIKDGIDVASEIYQRNQAIFSKASKKEIGDFALRNTNDAELVEIYFPGATGKGH